MTEAGHGSLTERNIERRERTWQRRTESLSYGYDTAVAHEDGFPDIGPQDLVTAMAKLRLPDEYHEVVALRLHGWTQEQVAEELGISRGAVRYRLAVVSRRMRNYLRRNPDWIVQLVLIEVFGWRAYDLSR